MDSYLNLKTSTGSLLILIFLLLVGLNVQAQFAYFPQEGSITYEKTVHVKNLMQRHINTLKADDPFSKRYYEEMRGRAPETAVLKKHLAFRNHEVSYEPVKETLDPIVNTLLMSGILDNQAVVYQNLEKGEIRMAFEMDGANIYIEDQLLDVKWKLTNEYRNIAGYECRRANGVTLDSVYLVAFYTDQIPTSAGPGAVHGLPGMILGLVVPEQHYNIYATKVDYTPPSVKTQVAGRRDKPATRKEVVSSLTSTLGQYMSPHQLNLLFAALLL